MAAVFAGDVVDGGDHEVGGFENLISIRARGFPGGDFVRAKSMNPRCTVWWIPGQILLPYEAWLIYDAIAMKKKRILVVDDEVGFTRLLKLVLSAYEIREENDPERAVATALEFNPDLILLDFIMPEMDGATLATSIREEQILRSVPIVFLTALAYAKDTETAKAIDGLPCLAKPVSRDTLIGCINQYLPD